MEDRPTLAGSRVARLSGHRAQTPGCWNPRPHVHKQRKHHPRRSQNSCSKTWMLDLLAGIIAGRAAGCGGFGQQGGVRLLGGDDDEAESPSSCRRLIEFDEAIWTRSGILQTGPRRQSNRITRSERRQHLTTCTKPKILHHRGVHRRSVGRGCSRRLRGSHVIQ